MRKSRFSDEQMVAILREADRSSVTEAAKKNKVSEQTRFLSREEAHQLVAVLPQQMADMVAFSLATGSRAANLTALQFTGGFNAQVGVGASRSRPRPGGPPR